MTLPEYGHICLGMAVASVGLHVQGIWRKWKGSVKAGLQPDADEWLAFFQHIFVRCLGITAAGGTGLVLLWFAATGHAYPGSDTLMVTVGAALAGLGLLIWGAILAHHSIRSGLR